ncbi:MAG: hypothetical protein HN733_00505 [Gammaproteobacteria bacterium]|jgi:hypothetical protein|nr:hypothetical protein [Gammaproteobacteria bacterium]
MISACDLLVGHLYTFKIIEDDNDSALLLWVPSYSTNDFVGSVVNLDEYYILVNIVQPPLLDNHFNAVYIGKNNNIKLLNRWPYSFVSSNMTKISLSDMGLDHVYTV